MRTLYEDSNVAYLHKNRKILCRYSHNGPFSAALVNTMSRETVLRQYLSTVADPSFGKRSVEILVADCGLCKSESAVLERYCRGEGLCFCKVGNCGKAIYDNICKESPDDV